MKTFLILSLSALIATSAAAVHTTVNAADAIKGAQLYQSKCAMCHSADFNGAGPAHKGVFGRKAGLAAGYTYSPSVKNANITWDEANLLHWLADPEKTIPGQKMYISVPDASDRADLVAHLKTLIAKK